MCLKEVSHVFYFILLGAISLAFKDIVREREEKRFELLKNKNKKPSATQPAFLYRWNKQTKKNFFCIHNFFLAGILGQYIKFPQKEALELFT